MSWTRDEPQSPCVQICVLDRETGYCIGCQRTGDEIAAWSKMSNADRAALLAQLPARAEAMKPRRKGGHRRQRAKGGDVLN